MRISRWNNSSFFVARDKLRRISTLHDGRMFHRLTMKPEDLARSPCQFALHVIRDGGIWVRADFSAYPPLGDYRKYGVCHVFNWYHPGEPPRPKPFPEGGSPDGAISLRHKIKDWTSKWRRY